MSKDPRTKLQQKEEQLKHKLHELHNIQAQINSLRKHQGITITDHAVSQFVLRTNIISFNSIKEQLLTDQVITYYRQLGDGTYPTGVDNIRVVIKNATIVTVLT